MQNLADDNNSLRLFRVGLAVPILVRAPPALARLLRALRAERQVCGVHSPRAARVRVVAQAQEARRQDQHAPVAVDEGAALGRAGVVVVCRARSTCRRRGLRGTAREANEEDVVIV